MMKKMLKAAGLVLFLTAMAVRAHAEDEMTSSDPEDRARKAHELSMSDVMYQQEDFRALYYQNLQIIDLLKEVRDEMHSINMRSAKEDKKT